ncbi:TspO/MBR-related protein [Eremomyces bilateralis CBS 781.70]|uniref:TspO/MBR-related protein n=1 Tax=Eremomyces bilateralis CBS 781.70 TaxID=1392243 RepID=A0A6G1G732_9PEZI|nr:TspO/MBR-related protein [Eremomyces bilateralis CBS 781.70]KAF1813639.1 TspO/MBR-related protein [Eremomyces bilateralis CBS 781.70]
MTTHIPCLTLPSAVFNNAAASILLPLGCGNAVGYLTRPREGHFYPKIKQPLGNPPAWVFAPVWTALYATMGYAAHRAWTTGTSSITPRKVALARQGGTLYTIQLGLNLLWMPLFFGLGKPLEATVDIVALLGVTSYLTYIWSKVDKVSAWLMVPYLGWLSYATYLSAGCGHLNGWSFKQYMNKPKPS